MKLQQTAVSVPSSSKTYYAGIDLVKFLCAILVFCIHIPPMTVGLDTPLSPVQSSVNFWLQNYLCRLAVPFYFVCSGFFLYKKMPPNEIDVSRVKNYCFKILLLSGAWKTISFLGGVFHLWYLSATVVAVTFLSICLYFHMKPIYLFLIASFFYILGLLGDAYFGLIEPFVSGGPLGLLYGTYTYFIPTSRNGLFMGVIFVLMGYLFAQKKIKFKTSVSLGLFVASMIVLFAEVFLLDRYDIPDEYNMYLFLLPATFFLFAFASSLSLKSRPIYAKLRTVGSLTYYLHMLLFSVVNYGISMFYGVFKIDLLPYSFFLAFPVTLLVAFVLEKLARHEKFKWLNWFLS